MARLTPKYWDCECESGYIHHYTADMCPKCGARRDEMPDSHLDEVKSGLYFYRGAGAKE